MKLSWKMIGALCGVIGPLLFVIITAVAMVVRPTGYNFFLEPFSALGLTVTNGFPSMLNYYLFVAACTIVAVCMIPFWFALRSLFTETTFVRVTGWIGTIIGLASVPFLSGLAILAADAFHFEHGLVTTIFFLLISSAVIIYSIAISVDNDYTWLYAIPGIVIGVICCIYVLAPSTPPFDALGSAAMQKVVVYGLVSFSSY